MKTEILTALSGLGVQFDTTGKRPIAESFETSAVLPYVRVMEQVGELLAREFQKEDVFAVVGIGEDPVNAIVVAQWTASKLSTAEHEVLAVRACRKTVGIGITLNGMTSKELAGQNVIVVTDVLATGATVRLTVSELYRIGAKVIGIGAIGEREDVVTRVPTNMRVHTLFGIKRREPVVRKPPEKKKRS